VPRPADIRRRLPFRRQLVVVALASVLASRPARADGGRLVLGTHDPALASALSVAVSPRGLSVVELPEPLTRASDIVDAQRALLVHDAVGVVWLCDDDAGARALCFCDRDGRLTVKPILVTSPLAAPDAAALALSVKVRLGPALAASAPARAPPAAPASAPSPRPDPAADTGALPALTVELRGGARLQGTVAPHAGLRLGLEGELALDSLERELGIGAGVSAGPSLAGGYGRAVDDLALSLVARGQRRVGPLALQLDVDASAHFLSTDAGATERRTELSLDALAGVVWMFGRYLAGLRAGGIYVPFAETGSIPVAAGSVIPLTLPRWNAEAMLTLGVAFP
jgi:hypothetical protein